MDIKSEKLEIIQRIINLKGESMIENLKLYINNLFSENDWWDEVSEEEKRAIEEGLKDIEEGKVISYEEVRKRYEKWL